MEYKGKVESEGARDEDNKWKIAVEGLVGEAILPR